MIVATAGHIDHGKTALVKALTGVDADRLPEEKRRGITVDLGFAYRHGADGRSVGFIDVPGHERLVRTMVAGASGVDYVLLVVAADDGVMPQTREHLAILDLIGTGRGLVAVTKADRVDAAQLARTVAEVEVLLGSSSLAGASVLPVSAHRGDGLAELAGHLEAAAASVGAAENSGHFRLAIDRAFTLAGAGLVVTGTAHAGRVAPGDRLVLLPGGREARVRGLRAHDRPADVGAAGQRLALNLVGPRLEKRDISRGDWIVAPELATATARVDVRVRLLPTEGKPLRHWTPVHVHLGAADLIGRVALLEGQSLAPGAAALGQLVLDAPTSAHNGDRFVLRDQSARRTIGGGRVIDPRPPARNARKPARLGFLRAFETPEPGPALDAAVDAAPDGLDAGHFAFARNLEPAGLAALAEARGLVRVAVGRTPTLFAPASWAALRTAVLAALADHAERHPDSFGATMAELARAVPPGRRAASAAALDALVAEGAAVRLGQLVQLPGHTVSLSLDEEHLWEEIAAAMRAAALDPLRLTALAERLRLTEGEIGPLLQKLGRMGRLRRVSKSYFLLPEVVATLARITGDCAAAHPERLLTVGRFREASGISRHATMPVLEFFDRVGFTRRHNEGRRLRAEPAEFFDAI